jgi:hypothetical protein
MRPPQNSVFNFNTISAKMLKLPVRAFLLFLLLIPVSTLVNAEEAVSQENGQVMQGFTSQGDKGDGVLTVEDHKKRLIMFILGAPLLVMILITGGLGVAMGVYGKQVFVAHMLFAGLSMTLAIAHAIVGIVWFYPF